MKNEEKTDLWVAQIEDDHALTPHYSQRIVERKRVEDVTVYVVDFPSKGFPGYKSHDPNDSFTMVDPENGNEQSIRCESYNVGRYNRSMIEFCFNKFLSACVKAKKSGLKKINTGLIGAGAFPGSKLFVIIIQKLAAKLVGIEILFTGVDQSLLDRCNVTIKNLFGDKKILTIEELFTKIERSPEIHLKENKHHAKIVIHKEDKPKVRVAFEKSPYKSVNCKYLLKNNLKTEVIFVVNTNNLNKTISVS